MYLVGATLLKEYWAQHPEAEGELRALHALLLETPADALQEELGGVAIFHGNVAELRLREVLVRLRFNAAAGVASVSGVFPREGER
jgi:hypothetical protein